MLGEAGIGKSRLCYEFTEHCRRTGVPVLEARVAPFGKAVPYRPILDLLRDYFGIRSDDDQSRAREKISIRLSQIGIDETIIPALFEFLGLVSQAKIVKSDPAKRKAQLLDFVCEIARRGSNDGVSVIFIEDLHWLDAASEAVVEALAAAIYGSKAILLLNFRPGVRAGWMQFSHYRQLRLEPLGDDEAKSFIGNAVGEHALTGKLRRELAKRSQGNPFFLGELIRSLVDAGGLEGTPGAYRPTSMINMSALPPTVQGVLESRIDNLDPLSKHVLQIAAVIGREIPLPILSEVAALSEDELSLALSQLRHSELLYEMPLSAKGFLAFRHPLVQEVAYHGLLTDRRRSVHSAVAKSIVKTLQGRLDEFSGLLAFHLEEAGDPLGAAQAPTRCAIWVGASDARQALFAWRRACEILDQVPVQKSTDLMRMMANGQVVNFAWREGMGIEEARPFFERATAIAVSLRDLRANALVHAAYGRILAATGSADDYVSAIETAQALSKASTDKSLSVTLKAILCHALRLSGRLSEALDVNEAGLENADELAMFERQMLGFDIRSWLLVMRGQTLVMLGRGEEARPFLDQVVQVDPEKIDPTHYAIPSFAYVDWAWATGDPQLAEAHAMRAMEIAERQGTPYLQVYSKASCALAWLTMGRIAEAIALWRDTLEFGRMKKAGLENEPRMLADLAGAYVVSGNHDLALRFSSEAIRIAQQRRSRISECLGHIVRASALESAGDHLGAGESRRSAQALLVETGAQLLAPLLSCGFRGVVH